jgi:hypothetical protein
MQFQCVLHTIIIQPVASFTALSYVPADVHNCKPPWRIPAITEVIREKGTDLLPESDDVTLSSSDSGVVRSRTIAKRLSVTQLESGNSRRTAKC